MTGKQAEERNNVNKNTEKARQVETVLVVDDDENWCYISKKLLQKSGAGEKVITAHNGLEAVNKLQDIAANGEKLPGLIFLDIRMPVMDGFGFLDEVTKSAELDLSQTRIYVCTSSFLDKDKERANLYPISGFVTKPLTKEVLRDILQSD